MLIRSFLLLGLGLLSGCSWNSVWNWPDHQQLKVSEAENTGNEQKLAQAESTQNDDLTAEEEVKAAPSNQERSKEPPISVDISHAFIEQGKLHVKVYVEPKTSIPAEMVEVAVTGLREGQVVENVSKRMSEVIPTAELEAGRRFAVLFSLESAELTEYQVKCSWGSEVSAAAKQAVADKQNVAALDKNAAQDNQYQRASLSPMKEKAEEPRIQKAALSLEDIKINSEVEQCEIKPCDLVYTLEAKIQNNSKNPIAGIRMALGLYWTNEGQDPIFPVPSSALSDSEELIRLEHVNIPPAGSKKVRVQVDRSIPVIPGGKFIPHLRLLSFQETKRAS